MLGNCQVEKFLILFVLEVPAPDVYDGITFEFSRDFLGKGLDSKLSSSIKETAGNDDLDNTQLST